MSTNTNTNIIDVKKTLTRINMLYLKTGYMQKYGADVWVSFILCAVFSFMTIKYTIKNAMEVLRIDWDNNKCNPAVLPFAGNIMNTPGQSPLIFTISNFNGCINGAIKQSLEIAVEPLKLGLSIIQDAVGTLVNAVNDIRVSASQFRKNFDIVITMILNLITGITTFFINFFINIKDMLAKINAVLAAGFYTAVGSYMTLKSFIGSILELITLILFIIAAFVILMFSLSVPSFGVTTGIGFSALVIGLLIGIPLLVIEIILCIILDLGPPPMPGIPGCFVWNTNIVLYDKSIKCISDIVIGDRLKVGGVVTDTIAFNADQQSMFELYGIKVTGNHLVQLGNNYVKVSKHPDSIFLYKHKNIYPLTTDLANYVYCINTTTKRILIGNTLFSDWDDIDNTVIERLNTNCVLPNILPNDYTFKDIHTFLDCGLYYNMQVNMADGTTQSICNIKIGDILKNGVIVLGTVSIKNEERKLFIHTVNNTSIKGTRNIYIHRKPMYIKHDQDVLPGDIHCEENVLEMGIRMFNLITDKGTYYIEDVLCGDYNSGIDRYL